jgi:hypothetical protein
LQIESDREANCQSKSIAKRTAKQIEKRLKSDWKATAKRWKSDCKAIA